MKTLSQELIALVPPPLHPVGTGTQEKWAKVERKLGTPLPSDYKCLVDVYGTGRFADWINLYSPFAAVRSQNMCFVKEDILGLYRESMNIKPADLPPFPAFPEPGGLLPWGGDDNGCEFCWATNGSPEEWIVINLDADYTLEDHRTLGVGIAELLAGWFSGQIVGDWYPEDVQPTKRRYFIASCG